MHFLVALILASGLLAGESQRPEPPEPGRDKAFRSRILAGSEGGSRPWKTFRMPSESGSAVVEVVGEFTREEYRQMAFQEFLAWFREDLRRFWLTRGSAAPATSLASAGLSGERFGGNPVPRNVPLGRVNF